MHANEAKCSCASLILPMVDSNYLFILINVNISDTAGSWVISCLDLSDNVTIFTNKLDTMDGELPWNI